MMEIFTIVLDPGHGEHSNKGIPIPEKLKAAIAMLNEKEESGNV